MPHTCTTCIRTQLCAHADTHTNIHACSCVCIPHTHKVAQEHTKNCWKAKTVRRQTESGEKVMWSHCQKNTHNLLTWHGILSGAGVSVSSPLHLTNSSSHPNLKMKYTHTHAHTHTTHTPQTHITHTHTHTHTNHYTAKKHCLTFLTMCTHSIMFMCGDGNRGFWTRRLLK